MPIFIDRKSETRPLTEGLASELGAEGRALSFIKTSEEELAKLDRGVWTEDITPQQAAAAVSRMRVELIKLAARVGGPSAAKSMVKFGVGGNIGAVIGGILGVAAGGGARGAVELGSIGGVLAGAMSMALGGTRRTLAKMKAFEDKLEEFSRRLESNYGRGRAEGVVEISTLGWRLFQAAGKHNEISKAQVSGEMERMKTSRRGGVKPVLIDSENPAIPAMFARMKSMAASSGWKPQPSEENPGVFYFTKGTGASRDLVARFVVGPSHLEVEIN